MTKSKFSISRLTHFIDMLRAGEYPNHPKLLHQMRRADLAGAYSITQKTLQRDVAFLKETYGAPIEYDYSHHGYYLTNPNWSWESAPFDTVELDMAILSSRLAESIMPSPLGEKAGEMIATLLRRSDSSDKYSNVLLALIANGSGIPINADVFIDVFGGWLERHLLRVQYTRAMDGASAELLIEPHILAFHEGCWYLRVKLLSASNPVFRAKPVLTLALHRISYALKLSTAFQTDPHLLAEVSDGHIFDFPLIKGIRMLVRNRGYRFVLERLHPTIIRKYPDDSAEIELPPMEEYKIANFVFCWPGEVQILEPEELRDAIRAKAQTVLEGHTESPRGKQ